MNGDSALFCQVTLHPHVMVAWKDMHCDAPVSQGRQSAEKPGEPFWNHLPVFPPEVEDIAKQPDRFRISRDPVEPLNSALFALTGIGPGSKSKVKVGRKI